MIGMFCTLLWARGIVEMGSRLMWVVRYDIIWTDPSPYDVVTSETSENCPGLDG